MNIEEVLCSGCHSCYSVCPKNAIKMQPDSEGFLQPFINQNLCIKCGICEKNCPVLNPFIKNEEETKAFLCINNDEDIRLQSSSGGIFTEIAEKIIDKNGVVFGAKFDENFKVVHSYTESKDDLKYFRGSKYVQSEIGDVYKQCKFFLDSDRYVMFTGTPCQIAGLKSFLKKDYDKLFLVDFICHGVPSPKILKRYIEYREKKSSSKIQKIAFRQKNSGWKLYSVLFDFMNNTEYTATLQKDPYMQFFMRNNDLRNSCYDCSYKGIKRISDITLADFWGVWKVYPENFDNKGTSFITVHTKKGHDLINNLQQSYVREIPIEIGADNNKSMTQSVSKPNKRLTFYKDLDAVSFDKLIRKYAEDSTFEKLVKFIRRCIGKILRMAGLRK